MFHPSPRVASLALIQRCVREAFDLDPCVEHQHRRDRGSCRWAVAEILRVDFVETAEVARLLQPNRVLDDIVQCTAGLFQYGLDVFQNLSGLDLDTALYDLPIGAHRQLTGNKDEVAGSYGLRERIRKVARINYFAQVLSPEVHDCSRDNTMGANSQTDQPRSAYVIVQINVRDASLYETYKIQSSALVAACSGRYLSRGPDSQVNVAVVDGLVDHFVPEDFDEEE